MFGCFTVLQDLLYLGSILKENTSWDLVGLVRPKAFLQDVLGEPEGHQSSYGLSCTGIVRTRGLYLTARGKGTLKWAS